MDAVNTLKVEQGSFTVDWLQTMKTVIKLLIKEQSDWCRDCLLKRVSKNFRNILLSVLSKLALLFTMYQFVVCFFLKGEDDSLKKDT